MILRRFKSKVHTKCTRFTFFVNRSFWLLFFFVSFASICFSYYRLWNVNLCVCFFLSNLQLSLATHSHIRGEVISLSFDYILFFDVVSGCVCVYVYALYGLIISNTVQCICLRCGSVYTNNIRNAWISWM